MHTLMEWTKTRPSLIVRGDTSSGAVFSRCERYRPLLWRHWASGGTVLWICLNPSTADEHVLDNTLTRCQRFSQAWGYGCMVVCNLFDWRATDPKAMRSEAQPASPENDPAIEQAITLADRVVCGWGAHGTHQNAHERIMDWLPKKAALYCLGLTQAGLPKHPLYLRRDLTSQPFGAPPG